MKPPIKTVVNASNNYLEKANSEHTADAAAGIRYLYHDLPEPLSKSLRRRVSLLWELATLRPQDYWQDEWATFRKTERLVEKVTKDHPDYDKAEKPDGRIFRTFVSESPWKSLIAKEEFPHGLGNVVCNEKENNI